VFVLNWTILVMRATTHACAEVASTASVTSTVDAKRKQQQQQQAASPAPVAPPPSTQPAHPALAHGCAAAPCAASQFDGTVRRLAAMMYRKSWLSAGNSLAFVSALHSQSSTCNAVRRRSQCTHTQSFAAALCSTAYAHLHQANANSGCWLTACCATCMLLHGDVTCENACYWPRATLTHCYELDQDVRT
jgi:hypothetical protein